MPRLTLHLGVLARRTPPATRWSTGALTPSAVLMPVPPLAPRTRITEEGGVETWYLGPASLTLYSGDTGYHRDNLGSGRPAVWVALRGADPATAEVVLATADPYEGEGYVSDPALTVEAVAMPADLAQAVADFIAAHHVEIIVKKRQRQPADPDALQARAPRIQPPEQKWGPKR